MLTALFLFVLCFPFPFHLMLSSPDFTLALVFLHFQIPPVSLISFFFSPRCCSSFLTQATFGFLTLFLSLSLSLRKCMYACVFFIVIKMEIEHNDMQSRFIHFISIPMFVFLVAFSDIFFLSFFCFLAFVWSRSAATPFATDYINAGACLWLFFCMRCCVSGRTRKWSFVWSQLKMAVRFCLRRCLHFSFKTLAFLCIFLVSLCLSHNDRRCVVF